MAEKAGQHTPPRRSQKVIPLPAFVLLMNAFSNPVFPIQKESTVKESILVDIHLSALLEIDMRDLAYRIEYQQLCLQE